MAYFRSALAALLTVLFTLSVASDALAQNKEKDLMPGIIGQDNRRILDEVNPYRAVGRLNIAGSGFCTATLIAPDLVVTAAHCLYIKRTGRQVRPDRVHFLAAYRKGKFVAHRIAKSFRVHPDFTPPSPKTVSNAASDVALVRLEKPIIGAEVRPLRIGPLPRPGETLVSISYSRDRSELPSIERNCETVGFLNSVIFTNCDTNFGGSGGPLLVSTDRGTRLAGVMSGTGEFDIGRLTFAAPASPSLPRGSFR